MTCLMHDVNQAYHTQPVQQIPHVQYDEVLFADDTVLIAESADSVQRLLAALLVAC